jgi:hypothetical protein
MGSTALQKLLADTKTARKKGVRFFFCNTNRDAHDVSDTELEDLMFKREFAAVWTRFNYPRYMNAVEQGHVIFMYANGVGFVGVGQAEGGPIKLSPHDRGRLRDGDREEWRVKVDSFHWLDDEQAFPSPSPGMFRSKTFIELTPEKYGKLIPALGKHFCKPR